jgi:hypothetical protein
LTEKNRREKRTSYELQKLGKKNEGERYIIFSFDNELRKEKKNENEKFFGNEFELSNGELEKLPIKSIYPWVRCLSNIS